LGYQDFEISLIQMLSDPDEWTRASAVWVLGEIEAPHLVHMIEKKLDDSSPAVRENAVRALGKQGSEEKIRQMTEFLEDSDRRVREAAREVMRKRLKLSYEIQ
jgi:HEAT repeat protein